jgi:hypothetical protein
VALAAPDGMLTTTAEGGLTGARALFRISRM